ncbi:2-oxoglutarate dehydrogenase E1 component [Candidatus Liberibacter americanus]|uniref:2-oxoglutarate dehydrogenase E1 component n=1 Tax=Candidatus Liberibacter americanus str. Sao Paulo TaxID=1261131 RepID=U6B5M5_9HYPH|nr:2-oxoglutarate dehydrogenase E1 component [Candidatus Liberibacter americanus]AHA28113.1 Pyruvate and 2-oxoglutarate dehydrogenase, E1 component [Candidatus Liberibacter americanus str. Sao Paulo]EMS36040.1 alpha-ketoglutarate decarboxylase [Candidatus Liberibacter americanus PW_SP]
MVQSNLNKNFSFASFLDGANLSYIEDLYISYKDDPFSVCKDWYPFFLFLDDKSGNCDSLEESIACFLKETEVANQVFSDEKKDCDFNRVSNNEQPLKDYFNMMRMVDAYRSLGHLNSNLDPLNNYKRVKLQELSPSYYGFTEQDYNRKIDMQGVLGLGITTINEVLKLLLRLYCANIGVEFMHIVNLEERDWIRSSIEKYNFSSILSIEEKKSILDKLIEAEGFEKFIDIKYKGAKRFGADGSESIIPAIEEVIIQGVKHGSEEIVLGMAHRGRLNVLSQIMNKPARAIFYEFKGEYNGDASYSGDVKYHLGAFCKRDFFGKEVKLSLSNNPSHLEFVDPVVIGSVRAKQDIIGSLSGEDNVSLVNRSKVLPIIIHGDSSFAGQGVVYETFELSGLFGYTVAGSVHIIINNQIGFTTNPSSARSCHYPSDVAKAMDIPVFHVNGDDPEAVIRVIRIATLFRMKFHKSVMVDMFCYRRFGHNEGDEPSFTQPKMYQKIRSHKSVLRQYADKLISENVISENDLSALNANWRSHLESEFKEIDGYTPQKVDIKSNHSSNIINSVSGRDPNDTSVSIDILKDIGYKISSIPKTFKAHKIIQRLMENRRKMIDKCEGIDWAMAEALAFGSLCNEGYKVRLSGQDCERGTFSHRHAALYDQETESRYLSLSHISDNQGHCEIVNSFLSEQAVLGFEYGYSLENPNCLTIWEAQFGDFANGAQVILDQFVSSGEQKWSRCSNLVCLLPHGYEGQGPEHSSARFERFLQMCAENNMRVANCTSPANYFHILRRQIYSDSVKPLILMTPKSLLRHKRVISSLSAMDCGSSFSPILLEDEYNILKLVDDSKIRRVILCTGKVYYDVLENRDSRNISDIYLLRIEQLYPFPFDDLVKVLSRFVKAEMVWCQEEPKNMGAWNFIEPYLEKVLKSVGSSYSRFRYVGRPESASTAVGNISRHLSQLSVFIKEALDN